MTYGNWLIHSNPFFLMRFVHGLVNFFPCHHADACMAPEEVVVCLISIEDTFFFLHRVMLWSIGHCNVIFVIPVVFSGLTGHSTVVCYYADGSLERMASRCLGNHTFSCVYYPTSQTNVICTPRWRDVNTFLVVCSLCACHSTFLVQTCHCHLPSLID